MKREIINFTSLIYILLQLNFAIFWSYRWYPLKKFSMKKIFYGKKKKMISIILIGCLFYFKKHAFKKHKAQNAKMLRNTEENSQAEI